MVARRIVSDVRGAQRTSGFAASILSKKDCTLKAREEPFLMFRILALSLALIILSSCAMLDHQNGYAPPAGYLYQSNTMNVMMSPGSEIGSRTGEACAESWLGLVSTGEAGIKQAAAAGAILTVKAVDYRITRLFGIGYVRVCTIAFGD